MASIAQRLPPECGLISTVHDELIALAPIESAEQARAIVEDSMKEAMSALFPIPPGRGRVCGMPHVGRNEMTPFLNRSQRVEIMLQICDTIGAGSVVFPHCRGPTTVTAGN